MAFGSTFGLAQASHSAAGMSLAEGTASRVISDDAIENSDRSLIAISHRDGDQHPQRSCIARATSRPRGADQVPLQGKTSGDKTLKNHLVGVTRGAGALLRRLYRPGQERKAEDVAGDPGCNRRQFIDPIGDEMGAGAEGVT